MACYIKRIHINNEAQNDQVRHWPVIVMAEEEPLHLKPNTGYPVLMIRCAHQVHTFYYTDILPFTQLAAVCSAFDGHPLVNNVFTVNFDFIWKESQSKVIYKPQCLC